MISLYSFVRRIHGFFSPSPGYSEIETQYLSQVGDMKLSVPKLKNLYTVQRWRDIINDNRYIAVVQLSGGSSWGRANMRLRVLGDEYECGRVDARYAVPWAARSAAVQTRFTGLSELFRSSPSAVLFGNDVDAMLYVLKRARNILDCGVLVGGRFGEDIVTASCWEEAESLGGQDKVHAELITALRTSPGLLEVLNGSSRQFTNVFDAASGARRLVRVLENKSANRGNDSMALDSASTT